MRAIPAELEAIILRCLAKSPAARPESAASLRASLLELAEHWTESDALAWWSDHGERPSCPPESGEREARSSWVAPTLHALAG